MFATRAAKLLPLVVLIAAYATVGQTLRLSLAQLDDKIKGGWLGKTAGVCVGGPTEFGATGVMYTGGINLYPDMGGGFGQDDIYVQITFVSVMDSLRNGSQGVLTATMADYGAAFRVSGYQLWHANDVGRNNLRSGLLPPFSGMWAGTTHHHNQCANDIDFQIECDWIGLMCPAMPQLAQALSDSAGHVMNYGDGVYGGYFLGACDALAFVYSDVHTIVREAVKTMPQQSQYYQMLTDLIGYHDTNPDSTWQGAWRYITGKYQTTTLSCGAFVGATSFNISASLNGAYVAIGLLYGDGDILRTIEYACRCGQDSDCNPSNAAAVVGTMLGYSALPAQWRTSIAGHTTETYSYTNYTYNELVQSSIDGAKRAIVQMGGRVTADSCFIQPQAPVPPRTWEAFGAEPVVIDTTYVRACFSATPLRGPAPLAVQLNASCSIGRNLSFTWDFGDAGATATGATPSHTFQSPGTYTITLTTRNADTTKTTQLSVIALDPALTPLKLLGTPIVSVTSPSGAGSRDLNIIRDETYPKAGGFIVGYDTYNGQAHTEDYFGYTFTGQYQFTGLDHFYGPRDPEPQGGVFENIRVQVRVGSVWTDVTGLTFASPYNGATASSFDSVQLSFTPMTGDAIRIIGAPRGGQWVGCAELDVFGTAVTAVSAQRNVASIRAISVRVAGAAVTFSQVSAGARIAVRDLHGRTVRELSAGASALVVWDRRSAEGARVNPGIYLVEVSSADGRASCMSLTLTQ